MCEMENKHNYVVGNSVGYFYNVQTMYRHKKHSFSMRTQQNKRKGKDSEYLTGRNGIFDELIN